MTTVYIEAGRSNPPCVKLYARKSIFGWDLGLSRWSPGAKARDTNVITDGRLRPQIWPGDDAFRGIGRRLPAVIRLVTVFDSIV